MLLLPKDYVLMKAQIAFFKAVLTLEGLMLKLQYSGHLM